MTGNISVSLNQLTPEDVALVKTSWVEPSQKFGETCVIFFKTFFKNHPEYRQLFPFHDVPDDDWMKNQKFLFHSKRSIESLSSILDAMDNPGILEPIISNVREAHEKRNIMAQQFIDLKESFIEASYTFLNGETQAIEAMAKAMEVLTEKFVLGFQ